MCRVMTNGIAERCNRKLKNMRNDAFQWCCCDTGAYIVRV